LHMAQLMPLPLTVSCFSKIQIGFTLLVPAHLGSPGKRAIKRVCVCVCVCALTRATPSVKVQCLTVQIVYSEATASKYKKVNKIELTVTKMSPSTLKICSRKHEKFKTLLNYNGIKRFSEHKNAE